MKFGDFQIKWKITQISKSIKAYKKHGIEIFEFPNLNIKAKLKTVGFGFHYYNEGFMLPIYIHIRQSEVDFMSECIVCDSPYLVCAV